MKTLYLKVEINEKGERWISPAVPTQREITEHILGHAPVFNVDELPRFIRLAEYHGLEVSFDTCHDQS
jgi:hypothetical protein